MKRDEEYGKIKKTEAENNQKNEIRETATGSSENKAKKEGKNEKEEKKAIKTENEFMKKDDYDEQDIIDQISKISEKVNIPDSLHPENIEKLLEGKKQKKRFSPYQIGLVAAACVVVAAGIGMWQYGKGNAGQTDSSKVAAAGTQADSGASNGGQNKETKISNSKKIKTAKSYDEIYKYIKRAEENSGIAMYARGSNEIAAVQESASTAKATTSSGTETASMADTGAATAVADGSYSQTNVRQAGVDEGDIAKTDGTYLYVREDNGRTIDVVDVGQTQTNTPENAKQTGNANAADGAKTDAGQLKKYSEITLGEEYTIQEFYVNTDQKKLIIVCQKECSDKENKKTNTDTWNQSKTAAVTYDIRDIKKPVKEGEVTQSGTYNSSRMADGYLYLFSEYYTNGNIVKGKPVTYVPLINEKEMSQSSICLPPVNCGTMYEVISSIDITKPDETADNKAVLSQGGQMYVSNRNIYYYESEWQQNNQTVTTLRKISYKKGKLKAVAQGKVKGYLNDTFSLDEYKGNLRLFTTNDDENMVTILDKKLDKISSIENLAKGESIYSARFLGEAGYFVTYEQVDPLFSVDLSNPEKPKILGKLKIPGFSEYLHFYGENQLLGIGMSTDEESGISEGVKVTMFDISDRADVKEEATLVLDDLYGTNVGYDYKSVLADAGKNRIGFSGYSQNGETYCLLTYNENDKKFETILKEEVNGNTSQGIRGIYIQDTLYVISGNIIEAYDMNSGEKTGDIIL